MNLLDLSFSSSQDATKQRLTGKYMEFIYDLSEQAFIMEFVPILISFVISLLVSFILFYIMLQFSSGSELPFRSLYHYLSNRINFLLTDYGGAPLFSILWILYASIHYLIPFKPSDIFLIIQGLGGSSAIYYAFLAITSFQKQVSLTSFVLSSMYCFLFIERDFPIPIFLSFFLTLIFLPRDWVFFLLLIGRSLALEGGFALFLQLLFLYLLKDRGLINRTISLPFAILSCYAILHFLIPPDSVVKFLLFPLSGALALFFLYLARGDKEHFISFFLYFLNCLYLNILYSNKEAAYSFLGVNLFVIQALSVLIIIRIMANQWEVSRFPTEFKNFVFQGKEPIFLFLYVGLLFYLLKMYPITDWMILAQLSFIFQVGIINIYKFIFNNKTTF